MSRSENLSLPLSRCIVYAAPALTIAWLVTPLGIVQGIYAKYYGLSLTAIASVLFISRLFDAVTDPLIGIWSDHYHRRRGTRKPFILTGGLLFIVCSYFLYVPPADVGVVYFTCWFFAFYLAWTLFEIPHMSWGGEIASQSSDKTRIYSIRTMAIYAGLICFYAVPLLPIFESRAITPETLHVSVVVACLLMLPLLFVSLKATPDGALVISTDDTSTKLTDVESSFENMYRESRRAWRALRMNIPLLLFISAFCLMNIGNGMWYGLIFIYVDIYLGMGEQFAELFLLAFAIGLISPLFWCELANRLEKKYAWIVCCLLLIACFIYTAALTPNNTTFTELLLLKVTQTLGFIGISVISPAMLSEISDYGAWKLGSEQTATYFSVFTFMSKTVMAIGTALGLAVAGWYGFDASAASQSDSAKSGLILAMTWIPLVFAVPALVFIWLSPIDSRRHAVIRRRLDERRQRLCLKQI